MRGGPLTPKQAAQKIVECLDGVPRARAELLGESGVPDHLWQPAIRELLESGAATRIGNKRGARYLAGSYRFQPVAVRERSNVTESHCGLVDSILRDLAKDADIDEDASDLRKGSAGPEPVDRGERDEVLGFSDDGAIDRIPGMLRQGQDIELIDHRARGGCLWVIDEPGAELVVAAVERATGTKFQYKAEGARSTGWRAAWWTVAR